ncbi:MAG: pyruvate kinase [Deltaproteobacteria bacterium]|nr:pyruvate kinase [Deltaproteobacteria bacterium]
MIARVPRDDVAELVHLHAELQALRTQLSRAERRAADALDQLDPNYRDGAANLVHYVALRHADRRGLQNRLVRFGLSTLGRSEGHVAQAVGAVAERVAEALRARGVVRRVAPGQAPDWQAATDQLHANTRALLGPRPQGRHVAILVTLAWPAAGDVAWVLRLVHAGADCFRLNAAHDGPVQWRKMADAVRAAGERTGRRLAILVDLPGPKLRTGPLAEGPKPAHWRPERDDRGNITGPGKVALVRPGQATRGPHVVLPPAMLRQLQPDDLLQFRDLRDKKRELRVTGSGAADLWRGAFLADGIDLLWRRGQEHLSTATLRGVVGRRPAIALRTGDRLLLRGDEEPADPGVRSATGSWVSPPAIGCTEPQIVRDLAKGERVLFDDGHLEAVVERTGPEGALLHVVRTQGGVFKLRGDAGINVPDTRLRVPAIGPADREALRFAVGHADMVGLSFVRTAADVESLHAAMDACGGHRLGVVLKIETHSAFAHLPSVLLAAMRRHPVGVMIARGDLAVELGFERLAEVQEEILWFSEAAHLPVIWATQVLDTLARTGQPSRAEVTDAAMAVRAECVMLNKGDHIEQAVATLGRILHKMEQHQYKKRQLYRQLSAATLRRGPRVG